MPTVVRDRVSCFVDGFNLYHAIESLGRPELKWVCLRTLAECFIDPTREELDKVFYFTAIARHRSAGAVRRHQAYIRALQARGVEVVAGRFKKKTLRCKVCHQKYGTHEEKESDVNLALHLAYVGERADAALVVSGDSDLATPVRFLVGLGKAVRVITPPNRPKSTDLHKASGRKHPTLIRELHLERSALPDLVNIADGSIVMRPAEWSELVAGDRVQLQVPHGTFAAGSSWTIASTNLAVAPKQRTVDLLDAAGTRLTVPSRHVRKVPTPPAHTT